MKASSSRVLWFVPFVLLTFWANLASAQKPVDHDPVLEFSVQQTVVYSFKSQQELNQNLAVYKMIFQVEPTPVGDNGNMVFKVGTQEVILAVFADVANSGIHNPERLQQTLFYWSVSDVKKVCDKLTIPESGQAETGWAIDVPPTDIGGGITMAVLADQSRRNRIGVLHNPNYGLYNSKAGSGPAKPIRKKR